MKIEFYNLTHQCIRIRSVYNYDIYIYTYTYINIYIYVYIYIYIYIKELKKKAYIPANVEI